MCAATATGDWWARGVVGKIGGGFSHESEHDLALMVSDFLENGCSSGADSRCSSDSDSGLSDLHHLGDKISVIFIHTFHQFTASSHQNCIESFIIA